MTDFKIEKDVPMPKAGRPAKYPYATMNINESVVVDSHAAADAAHSYSNHSDKKFAYRKCKEGYRVWRVK